MGTTLTRRAEALKEAGRRQTGVRKGFTLIELLVVIAIIAILAAIAIPQYKKYKERAYVTAMMSDAHQIIQAEEAYSSQNDKYFATDAQSGDTNYDQATIDTSTGKTEIKVGNEVVAILSQDVNLSAINKETCSDGSPGYKFTLTHNKTKKEVTFDSCTDSAPQETTASSSSASSS